MMRTLGGALLLTLSLGNVALAGPRVREFSKELVEPSDLRRTPRADAGSRSWVERNGCKSDEGGYVIGRALGGASGRANIAPMSAKLNREQLVALEQQAKAYIKEWGTTDVFVKLYYDDRISKTRPTRMLFKLRALNGPEFDEWFENPLPDDWRNPCVCPGVRGAAAKLKTMTCEPSPPATGGGATR